MAENKKKEWNEKWVGIISKAQSRFYIQFLWSHQHYLCSHFVKWIRIEKKRQTLEWEAVRQLSNQGTRASEVYGTIRILLTLFYRPRSGEVRVRVDLYSNRNNTKIDMIWDRFDWTFCNWKFLFSVFNTVVFTIHERPWAENVSVFEFFFLLTMSTPGPK